LKSPGVKETTRPGGHWGYKQGTFIADLDKPARTVTAASTQDWVRLEAGALRRLTLAECAALQGFPRQWTFSGARASQFRQVGNAVPVTFGEVIGHNLVQAAIRWRRGETRDERPKSARLPASFLEYVHYTIRDEARNGLDRPRSQRRLQQVER
jgi:DNA (cytosine-5)-methyltransferase 1